MNGRGFFAAVVRDSRPRGGGVGMMMPVEAPAVAASEAVHGPARTDTDGHGRTEIAPEVRPRLGRVGEGVQAPVSRPLPAVPVIPSPAIDHVSDSPPWDRRRPAGGSWSEERPELPEPAAVEPVEVRQSEKGRGVLPPGRGRLETSRAQEIVAGLIPAEGGGFLSREAGEGRGGGSRAAAKSPLPYPPPRSRAGEGDPLPPEVPASPELVGAGLAPAREGVNPSPASLTPSLPEREVVGEAVPVTAAQPDTLPAAAPQQAVVVERALVTPSRVIPSGSEPGVAPQTVSRHETVPRSDGPKVHIGVVEIVVAAPAEKRAPAAAPAPSSNLASRRYLRSL